MVVVVKETYTDMPSSEPHTSKHYSHLQKRFPCELTAMLVRAWAGRLLTCPTSALLVLLLPDITTLVFLGNKARHVSSELAPESMVLLGDIFGSMPALIGLSSFSIASDSIVGLSVLHAAIAVEITWRYRKMVE